MPLINHLSGTSRALFRVFVAPQFPSRLRPLHPSAAFAPTVLLTRTAIRTKARTAQRYALSDTYTIDDMIRAPYVNLVDIDGEYHARTPLSWITYDKSAYHLLLVHPGETDEFGIYVEDEYPVCKIVSKAELRAAQDRKLEIMRRQEKGLGAGPAAKVLELNWAISSGDMKHRLGKLREFLEDGRKVEILLEHNPRRRGRKATIEECAEVLRMVRSEIETINGAKETREPEGQIGGSLTLVVERPNAGSTEKKPRKTTPEPMELLQDQDQKTGKRQETKQERRDRKLAERAKAKAAGEAEA